MCEEFISVTLSPDQGFQGRNFLRSAFRKNTLLKEVTLVTMKSRNIPDSRSSFTSSRVWPAASYRPPEVYPWCTPTPMESTAGRVYPPLELWRSGAAGMAAVGHTVLEVNELTLIHLQNLCLRIMW